jgi:limonene-1,2-epoxide hydrolase
MNNAELVNNVIKAFESHKAEALTALMTEDASFENVAEQKTLQGKQEIEISLSNFFRKIVSVKWQVKNILIQDNLAVIERVSHIHYADKQIKIAAMAIIEIENGKIRHFRDYFDANTYIQQNNNQFWD